MLRKTPHSRGSMRRGKRDESAPQDSSNAHDHFVPLNKANYGGGPSVIYQSKSGSNAAGNRVTSKYRAPQPAKIEVAPGLVIEGQEVDL